MRNLSYCSCIYCTVFFIAILLIVEGRPAWGDFNKTLIMGWGSLVEPFAMMTPDGKKTGFDIEILEAIVKRAGYKIEYYKARMTWARHLEFVKNGQIDLAASASWTEERSKWAYYTFPYRGEYLGLHIRKGESEKYLIRKIEDLLSMEFSLGVEIGVTYGSRIDSVIAKMGKRVQKVPRKSMNIFKLINNRINGYLTYPAEDNIRLRKENLNEKIELHPLPLIKTGNIYFLLSKKFNSYEVLEALNGALVKIQADGTYDKIVDKYSTLYGISKW